MPRSPSNQFKASTPLLVQCPYGVSEPSNDVEVTANPIGAPVVTYPTARNTPFDPPGELVQFSVAFGPLCKLTYPDGHVGWLVTGADLARDILTDNRFSARSELKRVPVARPGADPFIGEPALPGWFVDMDRPEHTRLRRVVSNPLSLRNMRNLVPRIESIVAAQLDAMAGQTGPVDLVETFALPVATMVICELLGVPYADHERFQAASECLFSLSTSAAEAAEAMGQLEQLIRGTLRVKRLAPGDDLLSQMVGENDISEHEAVGMSVLLLTAGHETVAGMIGLSVFYALTQPAVFKRLGHEPDSIEEMVEELLRYLTTFHLGVPRSAIEPVEISGQMIQAGETVTIALPAINRDPMWFTAPDNFNPDRTPNRHFAFGFGAHQCSGQHLARLEIRIALSRLAQRFPNLRLAVPPHEVPLRQAGFHGVASLPVTW